MLVDALARAESISVDRLQESAAVGRGREWGGGGGATAGGDVSGPAAYDPVTREWRALRGLGGPLARRGPLVAWTSTDLLVFGGATGSTEASWGTAVGTLQRLVPQPEWYLYRKL
jgi:hypothetical protein